MRLNAQDIFEWNAAIKRLIEFYNWKRDDELCKYPLHKQLIVKDNRVHNIQITLTSRGTKCECEYVKVIENGNYLMILNSSLHKTRNENFQIKVL